MKKKTLFYQVNLTGKVKEIINEICSTIECEYEIYQAYCAPSFVKEIWFNVNEDDVEYVNNKMSEC